jgi:exonuclease III
MFRSSVSQRHPSRKIIKISFNNIFEIMDNLPNDNRIIGGDFNIILDNRLDKKGGNLTHSHQKSQKAVRDWMERTLLVDIRHISNPTKETYTWFRKKPYFIYCRLDFF